MTRYERVLEGAAIWGGYYRANPTKFVEEYLHIKLKLFQKILITMMFWSTVFVFIAARGIGKTFLSAIYCCARCILYPGTKICIASGTRGQAGLILEKIMLELKPKSDELRAEIDEKATQINGTNAIIVFKNGSSIKVVTARDSARGNRANVLLLDEFRLIPKVVIQTILSKFLNYRRMPEYSELTEEERKIEYGKEKYLTMYLSSAYFKDHWSFTKCIDAFKSMVSGKRRQFVCGFPYQLSIEEGLLDPQLVEDEMLESDFSEVKHQMEMGALFYGSSEDAFFDFENIAKNRVLRYPMLPDAQAYKFGNSSLLRIYPKKNGEIRIISADVALMASGKHKNDAASIFINNMIPVKTGRYTSNIVYTENFEGMRTEALALAIRRMFEEYQCDYIVLDCSGLGIGVFDCLSKEMIDPDDGTIYPPLSCCNNKEMADRCTDQNARKAIWAIKASAQFNSDCAFLLREGFRSGRIRLLENEYDSDADLAKIKGYSSMSPDEKISAHLPYINTTLLIDELVRLEHEDNNGKIRVYERSGARKDRYSSLSYNYYVANQIEAKEAKKLANSVNSVDCFVIKAPSEIGKGGRRFG